MSSKSQTSDARARSAPPLQRAEARFPRSEPQASGDIHEARARTATHPQPQLLPRSEPKASGDIHEAGFTLIEMLAVVMMFGLIAAMVMPNIDFGGSRLTRSEAQDLAAAIEFARQRAVMTGRTHQVVIEVERREHWIEWAAPLEAPVEVARDESGEKKLDLVPPPLETEEFVPIPGELGRVHVASEQVVILGVELDGGLAEEGRVEIRITPDGAADPASILVADADGENALRIEVEPLADAVQIVHAE